MAKHWVLALIDHEGETYGIRFPAYPGCIAAGDSFKEAVDRGANALSFHLRGMAEDGDEIPLPPAQEDAVRAATGEIRDGALPAFIEIEFPGKAVRINITMEAGLLDLVDKDASRRGQTRSAYLADAARRRMHEEV